MPSTSGSNDAPIKDRDYQQPIPLIWQPTFSSIVNCFVNGDFMLRRGVAGVEKVHDETASGMQDSIAAYGSVTLSELTPETWDSSVAMWMDGHWETLVDLRTVEEGRSDLVLRTNVYEVGTGYRFDIYMIYVP